MTPGLVKSYEEINSPIRSVPVSLTLGWCQQGTPDGVFVFMNITTTFNVKNLQHKYSFEMEYFHDDDMYEVRMMEYRNGHWIIKQSMELVKVEAKELQYFLELTLDK